MNRLFSNQDLANAAQIAQYPSGLGVVAAPIGVGFLIAGNLQWGLALTIPGVALILLGLFWFGAAALTLSRRRRPTDQPLTVTATSSGVWAWVVVTNHAAEDQVAVQVEWHRKDAKPYLALWRERRRKRGIAWQAIAPGQTCTVNIADIHGWTGQRYIPIRFHSDANPDGYWDERMRIGDKLGCTITVLKRTSGAVTPMECDLEIMTAGELGFTKMTDSDLPIALDIGPLQLQREVGEVNYEAWNGIVYRCYLKNRGDCTMKLNAALHVALDGREDIEVTDRQAELCQLGRIVNTAPFQLEPKKSVLGDLWFGPFKAEPDAGDAEGLWLNKKTDRRWSYVEFTELLSGRRERRYVYDPYVTDEQ